MSWNVYDLGGGSDAGGNVPSVGDTKFSYRTSDHGGWYIINGRGVNSLPSTARTAAATLGWTTNIPNTRGRFPIAASASFVNGSIGGSLNIVQANLPNLSLSGSTSVIGPHAHSIPSLNVVAYTTNDPATSTSLPFSLSASQAWTMDNEVGGDLSGNIRKYPAYANTNAQSEFVNTYHSHQVSGSTDANTTGNNTSHSHTFTTSSLNSGVQAQFIPTYSAKVEFVYLGM